MISRELNCVQDIDLNNAWREVMLLCVKNGYDYVVKHGSYVGQIRKQLQYVTIKIEQPWRRPLSPILPPPYPSPTNDEKIEQYFLNYIISEEVHGNEDYTYGSFIAPQLYKVADILIRARGNTNQACINIGDRESVFLKDPPCLRVISFKLVGKKLTMSVFFRSWDLYAGMPENLGGLQLLKEYVLGIIAVDSSSNFEMEDGPIIAYSDGLHLYEQYFDLVNVLNIEKIKVNEETLKEKKEFSETLE